MRTLPNPRWMSQKNHPDEDLPDTRYTHMVMQFGQFLDHDLTLTPKDGKDLIISVQLVCSQSVLTSSMQRCNSWFGFHLRANNKCFSVFLYPPANNDWCLMM